MKSKLLYAAAALVLAAALAAGGALLYLERWGTQAFALQSAETLTLTPGQTVSELANILHRREIIAQPRLFVLYTRWQGLDTRLQAGEYALEPGVTAAALLADMSTGKVVQHQVQLLEGTTVRDVLAVLRNNDAIEHTLKAEDPLTLFEELELASSFAEGMFFPDTYTFVRGATDRSILLRAHTAMLDHAAAIWEARAEDLRLADTEALIILASIIEKETGRAADRGKISQVFHLRLKKRMLLQTDPTVIYGIGETFDGNLTRAHLRKDTPFNSYTRRGLPPTPIALPSAASLHAAAHPEAGEYLYFVARGDGTSQFSRTLAEHNAAVRRYQLGQGS